MIDLSYARRLIVEAEVAEPYAEQLINAYQAAQQVALAVIAAAPRRPMGRTDPWTLLARSAPELSEWAGFFAALAPRVALVQAGVGRAISERGASDVVRDAQMFLADAARWLRRREGELAAEAV